MLISYNLKYFCHAWTTKKVSVNYFLKYII